jgi:uncharacterized phage protein gp47/JayE
MTTFGVTATGFVADTFTDIVTRLEGSFQAQFGQNIDVSPTSVYGQIIQIMAAELADLWNGEGAVYAAFDPAGAAGVSLDNICGLTGTVRNPATYSTVQEVLVGTNGTVVPAASIVSAGVGGAQFSMLTSNTITTVSAWASGHTYSTIGTLVSNGGNIYYLSVAGVSAGSGGPSGTGSNIVDNTCQWDYIAAGTAAVVAAMQAVKSGPIIGVAGTLNYIVTPVSGWTSTINPLDAIEGANVETDAALRVRRESELHQAGTGTVDAIRSQVLNILGITGVVVFDNPTDTTDSNGVPPHAFMVMVTGSGYDVPMLLATIWRNKPAGIQAYGTITGTTPDSQGNLQTVGYTVPSAQNVYIVANVLADSAVWSSANAAILTSDVTAALLAYGQVTYVSDKDVVASGLEAQLVYSAVAKTGIAGVLDASCYIGLSPSPTGRGTIAISATQVAVLDGSRITVNIIYGSP